MVNKREIESALSFIAESLEHTNDRYDQITLKSLYDEYCESTKNAIGKGMFSKMLRKEGFSVMKGNGNVTTIFNIRSNWL